MDLFLFCLLKSLLTQLCTKQNIYAEKKSLRLLPAPQTALKVRRQLKRYRLLWYKLNLKIGFDLDPAPPSPVLSDQETVHEGVI